MRTRFIGCVGIALTGVATLVGFVEAQVPTSVTTQTFDGVTVYGESYFGSLDAGAPLILLFHQGGSSGRGEYAELAPWLNAAGYRAIAWDQRSGGEIHGQENRTVAELDANTDPGYCDASPDLQAALDYVTAQELADEVILWGSSYSGALVFRLAAENPDRVSGVIAFSPASGSAMVGCEARMWLDAVADPTAAFRPASEMARPSSVEQREVFIQSGAEFHVLEHGVHGSSMLLDSRTGHDMSEGRHTVLRWLEGLRQ